MKLTDFQAKYFAYELTRRWSSGSMGQLAAAVAGAQVDLNPHQVDAALFAFKSPFSNGALLADEVGLGKTIEAGILVSQRWAERKRRILIITPANLRKQWHQELAEKFFLPSIILESKSYKQAEKAGTQNPFQPDEQALVICSYHFARNKEEDVVRVPWDLVVIDEAHRLRNVYKASNVIAKTLKSALEGRPKVLLTATPLQNSLLELYGLVSFIDEHAFGDLASFRQQFANLGQDQVFDTLKSRLAPLCHRTLRRQVVQYVPYTARHALVEEFTPEDSEVDLYNLVSEYLRRENLFALPSSQRTLMTLVLRKLLASSTHAIAGALGTMARRLKGLLADQEELISLEDELDEDYESLDETADEWTDENEIVPMPKIDREALAAEIDDLEVYAALAFSIQNNAKGAALVRALKVAFEKAKSLGAAEKAIIFTESRRTQHYIVELLAASEWNAGIVLFNGSNNDNRSKEIYAQWKGRHEGTDRLTGSRTADMRSAIVDYFREEGRIMIATEAGAEGINLQFCSLVVNYDLPWNPQRVEQRIGRCHRYGQKHDVVVVNFLNKKNAADQRVYELLAQKFRLFEGIFGASDEVLGAIGSGVDFEKRIATIYQRCRQPEQIKEAFDALQLELSFEINEAMTTTREKLLEHFDDEVREKLRDRDADSKAILGKFERQLMRLSRHELNGHAEFQGEGSFRLLTAPFPEIAEKTPTGLYELPRRSGEAHLYRIGHPLADAVIRTAKERSLATAEIAFSYEDHEGKVSILEPFIGKSGWLTASRYTVDSLDQTEDFFILAAHTENGETLDEETARRLLSLPGSHVREISEPAPHNLAHTTRTEQARINRDISERNAEFFEAETTKLDNWADDLKVGLEREIKDIDRQIKEARRAASAALTLDEGNLFLIDQYAIRRITPDGNVITWAGVGRELDYVDGPWGIARFDFLSGLAVCPDGSLAVSQGSAKTIRKISPDRVVSTLAGVPFEEGSVDGQGEEARFEWPGALVVSPDGDIYLVDSATQIRKVTPSGMVTTLAGDKDTYGYADGVGTAAQFLSIRGLAMDIDGTLLVADHDNGIRTVGADGTVNTAISGDELGGPATGVAVGKDGEWYVLVDQRILKRIDRDGGVSSLAGKSNSSLYEYDDGVGTDVRGLLRDLTVGDNGSIYLCSTEYGTIRVALPWAPVAFLRTPVSGQRQAGDAVVLTAEAISADGYEVGYQWRLNGQDIPGAVEASYSIAYLQAFDAGDYTVVATVGNESTTSSPMTLTVDPMDISTQTRFLSLSTRAVSGGGENVMIPGFVIEGPGSRRILLRAAGATLGAPPFNIPGTLSDPRITLKRWQDADGVYVDIAYNDDWRGSDNVSEIEQLSAGLHAFGLTSDKDAALVAELPAGQYTAVASGSSDDTGIAIVEVWDASVGSDSARLISLSNRGYSGPGNDVMIPGFAVSNDGPREYLIRVVGPGLIPFGVNGTMADPALTLYRRSPTTGEEAVLLRQDNWYEHSGAVRTEEVAANIGAFALPAGSADAAFVVALEPGIYSVHGGSADGVGGGVVLVEVYELK